MKNRRQTTQRMRLLRAVQEIPNKYRVIISRNADTHAVLLTDGEFVSGGLQRLSQVRPGKLFTANALLFATKGGVIMVDKLDETRNAVVALIRGQD